MDFSKIRVSFKLALIVSCILLPGTNIAYEVPKKTKKVTHGEVASKIALCNVISNESRSKSLQFEVNNNISCKEILNLTISPPHIQIAPEVKATLQEKEKPFFSDPRIIWGLGAFFISLFSLGYTIWQNSLKQKRSVIDDYWLRKVILPKINDELNKMYIDGNILAEEYSKQYAGKIDEHVIDEFYIDLLEPIGPVKDSFYYLAPISKKSVNDAQNIIGDFEDNIENHIERYKANPSEIVLDLHTSIVEFLIQNVQLKS